MGATSNIDSGLDAPTILVEQANQKEIRPDVAKLYEMVSELKGQVEKTGSTSTLSLSVVKKPQQVEKLARHIKDLAKG
ncbi:MAG: hypothetical protein DMG49_24465 [Acidobacteria bacterium]|nr:MAG: hypothetical protein DMG49_24465 [Acidobacteriota bacterium]